MALYNSHELFEKVPSQTALRTRKKVNRVINLCLILSFSTPAKREYKKLNPIISQLVSYPEVDHKPTTVYNSQRELS